MQDPLDNLYTLDSSLNQQAHEALIGLVPSGEDLVWTGRPVASLDYYRMGYQALYEKLSPILFFGYFVFVYFYYNGHSFPIMMLYTILSFLFLLPVSFLWIEIVRRRTYYGISEGKVWIKTWGKDLQCYPVQQLPRLKEDINTIYYSTIIKQEYNKYPLLKSIPDAAVVYELIKEYQKNIPK